MPMPLSLRVPSPAEGKQPSASDALATTANPTSPVAQSVKDLLYYRELVFPLNEDDLQTLRQMRLASGTYYDRIPIWLSELESGNRLMWFVYLRTPSSSTSASIGNSKHAPAPISASQPVSPTTPISPASLSFILNTPPPTPHGAEEDQPARPAKHSQLPQQLSSHKSHKSHSRSHSQYTQTQSFQPFQVASPPLGMVCLLKLNPNDTSLASTETRRCELTSLWIYPMYRAFGIGAAIIAEMERQAAKRGALYVTFNTTAGCMVHGNGNFKSSATGDENNNGSSSDSNANPNPNCNPADYSQTLKTLSTFRKLGYVEYKPREHRYSVSDVLAAGLPVESTLAAFFEKRVDGIAI